MWKVLRSLQSHRLLFSRVSDPILKAQLPVNLRCEDGPATPPPGQETVKAPVNGDTCVLLFASPLLPDGLGHAPSARSPAGGAGAPASSVLQEETLAWEARWWHAANS